MTIAVQPDSASLWACNVLPLAFYPGDRTSLGPMHVQLEMWGADICRAAFDEWKVETNNAFCLLSMVQMVLRYIS